MNLADTEAFFSDATGAISIQDPSRISNNILCSYYSNRNRIRVENAKDGTSYFSARGAYYYKNKIPSISKEKQNQITEQEVNSALVALKDTDEQPSSNEESVLRLSVMDNLRGHIQTTYLSLINICRDNDNGEQIFHNELKNIAADFKNLYEQSIELQYGFMLGLDIDQPSLLENIQSVFDKVMPQYNEWTKVNHYRLSFKNPEIDNPLSIGKRANELIRQYPSADLLIGLSSGGIELATVSKLLFKHKISRDVQEENYPVTFHHGSTMWQHSKKQRTSSLASLDLFERNVLANKNVIVCDDNSNSGQTLESMTHLIKDGGSANVNFAVVELDPTRMIMHTTQEKIGAKFNLGDATSKERPIANYFHPDFLGSVGIVKIIPEDKSISKTVAQDTANKYRPDSP